MEQDEKLKMVYEQINTSVRYFLDWRHKLFVGYIIIISSQSYFILTWLSRPEHFNIFLYELSCWIGIILSILFFLLNLRNNIVIWAYQNNGYMYEKHLNVIDVGQKNPIHGLFGAMIKSNIKERINAAKTPNIPFTFKDILGQLNPLTHLGIINLFIVGGTLLFLVLLGKSSSFVQEKTN